MSLRGAMITMTWAEIMEAMKKDWPHLEIPTKTGPGLRGAINITMDYLLELKEEQNK